MITHASMSRSQPDFCGGGCRQLIMTGHPLNLCPDCDLRLQKQIAKDRAWNRTPLLRRVAIRLLQVGTLVCAFVFGSLAIWVVEPSIHRLLNHLWPLLTLVATFAGSYFSYQKAKAWECKITDSEPPVSWYAKR
jgi:hypothetical protein